MWLLLCLRRQVVTADTPAMILAALRSRVHVRVSGDVGTIRPRSVVYGLITVVALVAAVDFGSIAVTRLALGDNVKESGRAAVEAVDADQRITPVVAVAAYQAAVGVASERSENVLEEDFLVSADGSVTLTLQKNAPTLAVKYISFLQDYADVRVTWTQGPRQV